MATIKDMAMPDKTRTPAPENSNPGQQLDDNIDDLGNKPDGGKLDQPTHPQKTVDKPKGE
jgi:hypothetical protein